GRSPARHMPCPQCLPTDRVRNQSRRTSGRRGSRPAGWGVRRSLLYRLAAQIFLDVLLRTSTLVTSRPEPLVSVFGFRAYALGMNQSPTPAGLWVLLE